MITLYGTPISNYYNKAKMAMLEKDIPFTEEKVELKNPDAAVRGFSPLGKVPFIRTEQGSLCESQAILDYLEAIQPQPPLVPADPYAAAKVRELITFIDWHLEMAARQLYPSAFFGSPPLSEANLARVRKQLTNSIAAFGRLAKFSPYVAGDTFTQADCAAFCSLPVIAMATKTAFGEDLLLAGGVEYKDYMKLVGERPSAQRVVADRKAATAKPAA